MNHDQLPPHSESAERALLGCLLLDSDAAIESVSEAGVSPEWFYLLTNREIFEIITREHAASRLVDSLTIRQRLKEAGRLEAIGGDAYLSALPDAAPSAANAGYYLAELREKFIARRSIQFGQRVASLAQSHTGDPEDLLARIESEALALRGTDTSKSATWGRQSAELLIGDAQEQFERQGALPGFSYGLERLDSLTGGIHVGELTVVGARPSIGKTAFAGSVAIATALEAPDPIPTLFVTLESSSKAILRRIACGLVQVSLRAFRNGTFTQSDFSRLNTAAQRIKGAPLYLEQHLSGITASRLRSVIRMHARKNGIKVAIVDYLQKVRPDTRHEKRTYEVAEVSAALKAEAEASGVAVVALAQLNRDAEDKERLPILKDLADSGQIERDADAVVLMHRDRNKSEGPAKLFVAKQRDGEIGIAPAYFRGPFCRFYDATETSCADSMEDHP